jgi:hypothetical protein
LCDHEFDVEHSVAADHPDSVPAEASSITRQRRARPQDEAIVVIVHVDRKFEGNARIADHQGSGDREAGIRRGDGGRIERDLGVAGYVEEVRRAKMSVTALVPCVQAGGVDPQMGVDLIRAADECAVESFERALDLGQTLESRYLEADVAGFGVDRPSSARDGVGDRLQRHPLFLSVDSHRKNDA